MTELERLISEADAEREELYGSDNEEQVNDNEDVEEDESTDDVTDDSDDTEDDREDGDDAPEQDDDNEADEADVVSDDASDDIVHNNDTSFEPITVKVNGVNVDLESREEVEAYIRRNNAPAVKDPAAQLIEKGGLSQEDIAMLIEMKNGNLSAYKAMVEKNNIDLVDIEEYDGDLELKHQPEILDPVAARAEEIFSDPMISEDFADAINSVPKEFASALGKNINDLDYFADQVRSGVAKEIIAKANKAVAINGGSFTEHYLRINSEISKEAPKQTKQNKTARKINKKEVELRERAKAGKSKSSGKKAGELDVDDIWNTPLNELEQMDLRNL